MLFALVWRVRRRLVHVWDFLFLAKTLLSSLIMGAVLFFTADYFTSQFFTKGLLILIPLGALVFVAVMFLTKAVSKEIIALLRRTGIPHEEIR
jgi:hypothetical protein